MSIKHQLSSHRTVPLSERDMKLEQDKSGLVCQFWLRQELAIIAVFFLSPVKSVLPNLKSVKNAVVWSQAGAARSQNGVCSIFLRVDRSISEIHKPRAIFPIKVFLKNMYLYSTDIFYVHSFSISRPVPLKKHIFKKLTFFQKICFTAVKVNEN